MELKLSDEVANNIRRYSFYACGVCNTTRAMTFTRVTKKSKIIQVLASIINNPLHTQNEILKLVYGFERPSRAWCHGFFSALKNYGLVIYHRHGNRHELTATKLGKKFYNSLH